MVTSSQQRSGGRVWYIFPYAGGPGLGRFTRPYDLARQWRGKGVETTIFASAHHHVLYRPDETLPSEFVRDDIRYRIVPGKSYSGNGRARVRHMLGFTAGLWAAMRDEASHTGSPDAIIVSSPHPFPIWPAACFASRHGAKLIFEVRDIWPLSLRETLGTSRFHPFYLVLAVTERFAYRRADALVSLHAAALRHMTERGLAARKFNFIPNGAPDTDGVAEIDAATGRWIEQCRTEGRRIVGYAGSFGTPYAMTSFRGIYEGVAADPDLAGRLAFLFAGDGEERQPLEQALGEKRAKDGGPPFLFTGQLTREGAAELMQRCDAGLILSKKMKLFRHGIAMNKLSEYMRLGKPVLGAYEAGGDPVAASGCGWQVPPESPDLFVGILREFASMSPADIGAKGERGRRHFLENYEYSRIAAKYLHVLGLARDLGSEPSASSEARTFL